MFTSGGLPVVAGAGPAPPGRGRGWDPIRYLPESVLPHPTEGEGAITAYELTQRFNQAAPQGFVAGCNKAKDEITVTAPDGSLAVVGFYDPETAAGRLEDFVSRHTTEPFELPK